MERSNTTDFSLLLLYTTEFGDSKKLLERLSKLHDCQISQCRFWLPRLLWKSKKRSAANLIRIERQEYCLSSCPYPRYPIFNNFLPGSCHLQQYRLVSIIESKSDKKIWNIWSCQANLYPKRLQGIFRGLLVQPLAFYSLQNLWKWQFFRGNGLKNRLLTLR